MRHFPIVLIASYFLIACSQQEPPIATTDAIESSATEVAPEPPAQSRNVDFSAVSEQVETRAQAMLNETLRACTNLQNQVYRFLSNPTDTAQQQAQTAYRLCHQLWHQSAFYLQLPMQLSDKQAITNLNDLIDTRPFQPGYIDSIPDYPNSGLIFDIEIPLNEENLRSQHRLMDEESASLGFPVVEYFLWKTPADTFWTPKANTIEQNIVNRRLTYLKTATDQLLEQLNRAQQYWQNASYQLLPERAQRNWLVQSLQRHFMVRVLDTYFADETLADPNWWHPSMFAGEGRTYLLGALSEIEYLLAESGDQPSPFASWLTQLQTEVTYEQLVADLALAAQQLNTLPANYPMDTEANEQWIETRQAVAQLALVFSQLTRHFELGVMTE